jgi:tetratricopeptide (TPR) repeat protein
MYNLALIYTDLFKYDSSLYYYKLLYPLVPKDASVPYEIGLSYYYKYQYDSAIIYLEKAISVNNKKADYYAKAGDAYFDAASYYSNTDFLYQKAIDNFSSALKLDSTLHLSMNRLGVAYIYLKKYKEGIEIFELALKKDELYKDTYEYNLACIYSLQKQTSLALSYFERSIASGYTDLAHMSVDTDLDNIRILPAFKKIIEKYFKAEEISKNPDIFGKKN